MISLIEQNGERAYNITEFFADSIDDLPRIPKNHPGDMVYIASTGDWYVIGEDREWHLVEDEIGG